MDKLFKGYVLTKNKKCIEKFKDVDELKTYEQVKNLPEFAGILAGETILIDVDDYGQSEVLFRVIEDLKLNCRVYKTTRGKHFLFKNTGTVDRNRTGSKMACGLVADIKLGTRNSYSILKFDDEEREVLYDTEEYEEVPKWLVPVKSNIEFSELSDGDGRNQALFNYILTLQAADFTVEECRDCIRIINRYVLKNPLSDSELDVILRDESFNAPVFFKDKSFLFDKFAKYLKNNNHIVKINGQLHLYRDGVYVNDLKAIEAAMIKVIPNLNRQKRSEVMAYLELLVEENSNMSSANYIAFRNGIYDIDNDELLEFNPSIIITNKINYNYNEDAYSEIVDKTLNKLACHDEEIRALLEEVIGYCFYRRNELRKSFILVGDKANGKSTFLDGMVKVLLGESNTSALDLNELGERFKSAELFGKLANIGDDIGDEFIPNPAVFKKLVSGDRINVERKGHDPFDFNNYSKLLFSANNIPRIKDKSGAVIDRLIIVPFDATFSPNDEDFDPYIKYKLRTDEAMEYLIQIGLDGLFRVLNDRKFTTCSKVQMKLDEYEFNNNPILYFFAELELDDVVNNPTKDVYRKYNEFCLANSFQPMSNIEFSKQVKKRYDVEVKPKRIGDKTVRVFVK